MSGEAERLIGEGNRAEDAGDLARACELYRRAAALEPQNARTHLNLGIGLDATGDEDGATAAYERALGLEPDNPWANYNLGKLLYTRRAYAEGEQRLSRALAARPEFPEARIVRGYVRRSLGQWQGAATDLEAGLAARPDDAAAREALVDALLRLGVVAHGAGRFDEARECYRRLLSLAPRHAEAYFNLGLVERELGQREQAIAALGQALEIDPQFATAHYALGHVLHELDRVQEALACYERALALKPDYAEARWSVAMAQLPSVYAEETQPARCRERFASELGRLEEWFAAAGAAQAPSAVGSEQPFALAYQEQDNRGLLARYGALCARLMSEWQEREPLPATPRRGPRDKLNVGFVSSYFRSHSVWNSHLKGWLAQLDRSRFRLFAFDVGNGEDAATALARSRVDGYEAGPKDLRAWVEAIRRTQPDVLVYPEIGMDPMSLRLASLRLAPLQAASWGHPETTGLPTVDCYLSAADFEPAEADAYYTEKLVRLPHLGCHFERVGVNAGPLPGELAGMGGPLLVCPGVPFKYLPQHDWVLAEIARRLDRCRLVFFSHSNRALSERLAARLRTAFAERGVDYAQHVTFLPWQSAAGFQAVLRAASVYLDTIGFSGFNTALHAVECGLPIVTREGRFMRGRLASGILKRLGLAELVVPDEAAYVELAVRLAEDKSYSRSIASTLELRRERLYDDPAPVRALEDLLAGAGR